MQQSFVEYLYVHTENSTHLLIVRSDEASHVVFIFLHIMYIHTVFDSIVAENLTRNDVTLC